MSGSFLLVLAIALIATVCSEVTDEHAKTCIKKVGVSEDAVIKVIDGDFTGYDEAIECFAKCFFEESGYMNAEGDFVDAVAIDKLSVNADRAKVEALVNSCKLHTGSTPCETAYKIFQCFATHQIF